MTWKETTTKEHQSYSINPNEQLISDLALDTTPKLGTVITTAEEDFLDLSQAFSDFSACSNDISGAVKSLIYGLKTRTETSKQNAACALLSLVLVEENKSSNGAEAVTGDEGLDVHEVPPCAFIISVFFVRNGMFVRVVDLLYPPPSRRCNYVYQP
ncbi:uncharacterized protein HKW66_Vig0125970 [Vigna angularis]|uniref:Uncharacterized protein n=1 Tax=Phaseolus angularis TaxID=3914 RepID=A0A8T0K5Y4_PHAAN|nr:uncharacterized protein HKW66_Vig0125970 [Vigna angularis]